MSASDGDRLPSATDANGAGPRRVLDQPFRLMDWYKGCTLAAPTANVERWCGLYRGTELWVFNVTVAGQRKVACDGSDPACLRLSTTIFRSDVSNVYWTAGFEGDLLLYQADPQQAPGQPFRGTVFGWRPGWTRGRPLTSSNGTYCEASWIDGSSVVCYEEADASHVELRGGRLPIEDTGMPLPRFAFGVHGGTDVVASDLGDYLAFSLTPTVADKPSLYVVPAGQAGQPTARVLIANDARLLDVAPDGTRAYFLRQANYADSNVAGTLFRVDIPSGKNVVEMATGMVSAVAYRSNGRSLFYGYGEVDGNLDAVFRVFPDESAPSRAIVLGLGEINSFDFSDDLRFAYLQSTDPKTLRRSGRVFNLATQSACTLGLVTDVTDKDGNPLGPLLDRFSEDGNWVYWQKEVSTAGAWETWVSSTADCKPVARIDEVGSDLPWEATIGLVYLDGNYEFDSGILRHLRRTAIPGFTVGDEIFDAADRNFAVIPNETHASVLFTSRLPGKEGVYLMRLTP